MEGFRRAYDLPLTRRSFWPRRVRSLALVPLSAGADDGSESAGGVWARTFALAGGGGDAVAAGAGAGGGVGAAVDDCAGGERGDYCGDLSPGDGFDEAYARALWSRLLREPWSMLRRDWSWRASLPGAALATALWFVTTLLFGYVCDAVCRLFAGVWVVGCGDCVNVLAVHYCAERFD